jgi:hypothetical protein
MWAVSQPRRPIMDASNPSSPSAQRAWNKGKASRPEAAIAVGSCVVHSSQVAPGTAHAGLGPVQSRHRQQAAWLRPCRASRRRRRTQRLRNRSSYRPSEEDRSAGSFRVNRGDEAGCDDYLRESGLKPGQCLFPGHFGPGRPLTTRQYARLVSQWVRGIGLDPLKHATHSMRRTKATLICRRTGNLRAVQLLLGHPRIESTVRYLGVEVDNALEIAEKIEV